MSADQITATLRSAADGLGPRTISDPADARTHDDVTYTPGELDRSAPFYVAGHRGLVGSAVWRHLENQGFDRLIGATSSEVDLRDRAAVERFMSEHRPRYVVLAAARVGGIAANNSRPVDFLSDNLRIQVNVLDAALAAGVERVLFLGSSCIYPKLAEQPLREDSLLTGYLEPTNDAYAIAKIAGIMQVQAVRRQYGLPWISAMPTNLYGPGDNFSPEGSHVLPAMIRRYDHAVEAGATSITNWGSGSPKREFLHVVDLATACLHLLEHYDGPQQVNVGTGEDVTIRELADQVAQATGYQGDTHWDTSKPDGTPRKLMDVSLLHAQGWSPTVDLTTGLRDTVAWYRAHRGQARGL
ncbi:GDP-L-fucose synthase [Kocuria sp. cx-455]|uniref:GDP-L-fucose synthase family protein n=1 Tax=Kocuria sp. cx-455 TaxID=2771377 RepID=UPI001682F8FE|nr:GDP-L-fucose synthase [Kocuria sp. cx-455]MBD2766098.1 GDP-L-fucose synthase [Kocuria sp. cx-455]